MIEIKTNTITDSQVKCVDKFYQFLCQKICRRSTRLAVFTHEVDVVNDYWLEGGMPLNTIDLARDNAQVSIKIDVGDLKQVVENVIGLSIKLSYHGDEDGIDICCSDGNSTNLRFEVGDDDH